MEFQWVNMTDPDFLSLAGELDQYFRCRLGGCQSTFDAFNAPDTLSIALIVKVDGRPIACGALKLHEDRSAELKRIYVKPDCRHGGVAREMIRMLEEKALQHGCTRMVLETNPAFTDAVKLYHRLGYEKTENFGPYSGICTLCMAKALPQKTI